MTQEQRDKALASPRAGGGDPYPEASILPRENFSPRRRG